MYEKFKQYKESTIYSMSNLELLLLLYDEAVKRLKMAQIALEDKKYETFEECLEKTGRIVRYLIQILDMQYPISKDLKRIYEYLIYDISRVKAGRERRAEEIPRISHILSELRDAFNQAGKISGDQHTLIFYEAPHKLSATLRDMNKVFGNREIAIVREITKIHEEVIRTTLDEAVEKYADGSIKGEIVLVIKGAESEKAEDKMTLDQAIECARHSVESGMSVSEAAKQTAKLSGYKKGDIYKALLD